MKTENVSLRVTGHTCSLGPKSLNQLISEKRAQLVKEALVARGIDDDSALQMCKCKVDDFRFDFYQGGHMDVDFRVSTGDITNSVRKSASPSSTWFGGVDCVPSACRRKPNTMMIRVNEVIISAIAGSIVNAVSNASVCSDT